MIFTTSTPCNNTRSINEKTLQTIIAGLTAFAVLAIFQTVPTHAASFSVATGNDENTDNSSCSLSEAIENINDQAATNTDCPAGDGANDTITISAGTITLTDNLDSLTEPATVKGAGMGITVIDGDGQYRAIGLNTASNETVTISGMTITAYMNYAIYIESSSVNLSEVEVDGAGVSSNSDAAIFIVNTLSATNTVEAHNIYIHDINANTSGLGVFVVGGAGNGVTNANLSNITISDITNTGLLNNLIFANGLYGGSSDHTTNVTAQNISISNITSTGGGASGLAAALVAASGVSAINLEANNVTIIGVQGVTTTYGSSGGFVQSGAGIGAGSVGQIRSNITNLLLANNTSDGVNSNCSSNDITSAFGGSGSFDSTIFSRGGNLSSDSACAPYFNHAKDQNNLTNLGLTLAPLADNGGAVPTRALLQGSPAIDSGITVPTLTSDARGTARPQGLAYDSGAYESPFTTAQSSTPVKQAAQKLADTGESRKIFILCAILVVLTSLSVMIAMQRQKKIHKQ